MPAKKDIFLTTLSGLLLILSFPKFNLEILAWIALVPLFLSLRGKGNKESFWLSFLTGVVFFAGLLYWIAAVAVFAKLVLPALLVIVLFLSLYFGLFGFLSRRIKAGSPFHYLYLPSLWISLELIRSHFFLGGFPWGLLGYSQHLNLPLIQISSFTGIYGVSFLIVLVNVTVANCFLGSNRRWRVIGCWLLITGLLVGGSLFYGREVLRKEIEGESLRVAIVQGNIAQAEKWDWGRRKEFLGIHAQLTRKASLEEPALIIWPETSAVPGLLPDDRYLFDTLVNLSQESGAYLLVGGVHRRQGKNFNSAFLFSPRGIEGIFDKIHLVPFGEFLPGERFFPPSWRGTLRLGEGFKHGEELTLFDLPQGQFIVPICYEIIFPHLVRSLLGREADFIVNITNDAWFGKTAGPYQHAAIATFRAVEARRSLVRVANTGISLFIDPFGRREIFKVDNQPLFVRGTLTREIVLTQETTPYIRYGDIFAYLCLVLALLGIGASLIDAKAIFRYNLRNYSRFRSSSV